MEFLMTYGWAILVVLIAIGALAYFGVLNPSKFLPASCTIAPGIGCDDFVVDASGNGNLGTGEHVVLVLRNGLGEAMTGVVVTLVGDSTICQGIIGVPVGGGTSMGDGAAVTYGFDCTADPPIAPGRFKSDVTVLYTTGTFAKTKTGSIISEVQT